MNGLEKKFYKIRTVTQKRKLNLTQVFSPEGLVQRILDLCPSESLELRFPLLPGNFYARDKTRAEASKKAWNHLSLLKLDQPKTQNEAHHSEETPQKILKRSLTDMKGDFDGYSFVPLMGGDKRRRVVPFIWTLEAARDFAFYSELGEFRVKPYVDARAVPFQGGDVLVTFPQLNGKDSRYVINLRSLPTSDSTFKGLDLKNAIIWGINSEHVERPNAHKAVSATRYNSGEIATHRDREIIYPEEIVAYLATCNHFQAENNPILTRMNPFFLPSRELAEFYKKLENNVIIFDKTLSKKNNKFQNGHLHAIEKSRLLGRAISLLGPDRAIYSNKRDGKLRDYDWSTLEVA